MQEFMNRVETRFRYSGKELFYLLITTLVAAFILVFRKWGEGDQFNMGEGLTNFFISAVVIFIFLLIHFSAQKLTALKLGYTSEYKFWLNGVLISLILCFFTYGYLPIFFTGSLLYQIVPKLRVGIFRGGVKHKDLGMIAFAGPLSNLIVVGLLAPIFIASESSFIREVIIVNLLIAVYSLLPIPTFEKLRQFAGGTTGLYILIASRWVYVLVFATVIFFSVMILLFNIFSYIIALILGIATAVVYYSRFEMK
jgi:hypothetical protein